MALLSVLRSASRLVCSEVSPLSRRLTRDVEQVLDILARPPEASKSEDSFFGIDIQHQYPQEGTTHGPHRRLLFRSHNLQLLKKRDAKSSKDSRTDHLEKRMKERSPETF